MVPESSTPETASGSKRVGEMPPSASASFASSARGSSASASRDGGRGRSAASRKSAVSPRDCSQITCVVSSDSPLKKLIERRRKQPRVQGGTRPLDGDVLCNEH